MNSVDILAVSGAHVLATWAHVRPPRLPAGRPDWPRARSIAGIAVLSVAERMANDRFNQDRCRGSRYLGPEVMTRR